MIKIQKTHPLSSECGDKSLCLNNVCCQSNVYWNQPECNSCNSGGRCNGCKTPYEYREKNSIWNCYLKDKGENCTNNSSCSSGKCLGGKCCDSYVKQQEKCGSCSSSGWCNGCTNPNLEYTCKHCDNPQKKIYNCYPKSGTCEASCESELCLGGKCCKEWIRDNDKNCGECNSDGNCKKCKSGYQKNYIIDGSYKCINKKYIDMIGKITTKELNEVRSKLSYSMYKKFQDLNDYMRGECHKENKSVDMKVELDWDWELYDYAYFATKVVSESGEIMHSPYGPGSENMVGYKRQFFDRRTFPNAFNGFAEEGMDAYSQEGHKYNKFIGQGETWKYSNHYTNINHAYNDKYACFIQFSSSF